jgi:protein gp37
MEAANWHTFQVLTKRSERMLEMLKGPLSFTANAGHIWWGVSVEDKKFGVPRITHLQASPASVRFLSIEPLLEDIGQINLSGIHWAIVGGESGRGARPMKPEWVEAIRVQCERARVPFFFKQWGGQQKKKNGRELEGRTYNDTPLRLTSPIPDRSSRLKLIEEIVGLNESLAQFSV